MRSLLFSIVLCLISLNINAQEEIRLSIEEGSLSALPGLQSHAFGLWDDHWILIGGRSDGLHRRQPPFSFPMSHNNDSIYLVDPSSKIVIAASTQQLPGSISEQMQSTNMEYYQRDSMLYLIGGYAYSPSRGDHITFPNTTAVNLSVLFNSMQVGLPISGAFRQLTDSNFAVTGGYLGYLDSVFYLACGQEFIGRYNPHGPSHGPGFYQRYTNQISRFSLVDDGINLQITWMNPWVDTLNLHRRDYNMAKQIFPNGEVGYTIFSGVFQHSVDLPWLNTVELKPTGFRVRNDFNQLLNQYHSAHVPIYSSASNTMYTVFFGGISRFYFDRSTGNLIDDTDVPFVKTISMIRREGNDSMFESYFPFEMPDFMGAGASFIPVNLQFYDHDLLRFDRLPDGKTLIGYVYGGIQSNQENIFWVDDGTMSHATNRLIKVFLEKGEATGSIENIEDQGFRILLSPNPSAGRIEYKTTLNEDRRVDIQIVSIDGNEIFNEFSDYPANGFLDLQTLSSGKYIVVVQTEEERAIESLVIL